MHKSIGPKAFRPVRVLNAAVFDAVMVGLAQRLASRSVADVDEVKRRYTSLLRDDDFETAMLTSTTTTANVRARLSLGIEAFKDVQ